MADHADDDNNDGDIFVYRGGRAPENVTHVRIDKSVDVIEVEAFRDCERLVKVDTHDGIRRVGSRAFYMCTSLPQINLKSVYEIGASAFLRCRNLADVKFGDNLETIGSHAFLGCRLRLKLKLPSSVVAIGSIAFTTCNHLIDIELSEQLETVGSGAFFRCTCLQRIAIPLKRDLFEFNVTTEEYNQFHQCYRLSTVDLVGGVHKTVASLHMESWRTDMIAEINRINEILPSTPDNEKTNVIRQWMESALDKMDHYKAEHYRHVKEGITLLELALWKAKLGENEEHAAERRTKKVKVDAESARRKDVSHMVLIW